MIETFATDEHRIGLKPSLRRIGAPRGPRPVAVGRPRFEWLHVTAVVSPATGESSWPLSSGVSRQDLEDILALLAREAGAGADRILLVLDSAGRHSPPGLAVPEGIRLVYPPPHTPGLQPAETLWVHRDEPIANRHSDSPAGLDAVARPCVRLTANRDRVRRQAGFHRWPDRVAPIRSAGVGMTCVGDATWLGLYHGVQMLDPVMLDGNSPSAFGVFHFHPDVGEISEAYLLFGYEAAAPGN